MIPLFEQGGFVIAFEALPEHVPMRRHFVTECGWTEAEYRRLRGFAWFTARVSAWREGVEKAAAYLGGCCYRSAEEFYTTYRDDYFADMVREVLAEVTA